MAIPTLVLGLGGTGVTVLRYLKRLYEELEPDDRVPANFLGVDFDRSALMNTENHSLAELGDNEFLYLQPEGIQELVRNIDRRLGDQPAWAKILKWFPERTKVQVPASEVEANGAGQYRLLGRLGFFLNDEIIDNAVRTRLDRLQVEIDSVRLSKQKRVILVASVAGGTGAGMLVDMAYLARRHDSRPRVYAYLALPEIFHEVDHGGRIYQNAYAALRELAHFKNQQVPFEGDYYRIPPTQVDNGGEEPFARLFLFGRVQAPPESQTPLNAAFRQISEVVFAQLNRTIQEKSLAIISNTVSSSPEEERLRRSTHCFGTAGSGSIELAEVEVRADLILQELSSVMSNADRLGETFSAELHEMIAQAEQRIAPDQEALTPESAPSAVDAESEEDRAKSLATQWKRQIGSTARSSAELILHELQERLERARTGAGTREIGDLKRAREAVTALQDILLIPLDEGRYEENLENLKVLPSFTNVDDTLRNHVRNLLLTTSKVADTRELLERKMFYDYLAKHRRPFLFKFPEEQSAEVAKLCAYRDEFEKLEQDLGKLPWWKRITDGDRTNALATEEFLRANCLILNRALKDPNFRKYLETILSVRASKVLEERLESKRKEIENDLTEMQRPFAGIVFQESIHETQSTVPPTIRRHLRLVIREKLPAFLREVQNEELMKGTEEQRRKTLLKLVQDKLLSDPKIRGVRFEISDGVHQDDYREKILERLVAARQDIFVRRTPNAQRKGFGVLLVPRGIVWPDNGHEGLRTFLQVNAEQVLDCRCQIVEHDGKRIWIYYEDLFNPPEHIRHLDEYFRTYALEEHLELFHIDRRLLEQPAFRHIFSATGTFVALCGNKGCRHNVSSVSRLEIVCPGCGGWIRSRCGNLGCHENDLHKRADGTSESCPSCGGFNHGAWWQCTQHGKKETLISVDKVRCPACIERHLNDPIMYPESSISVRSDLEDEVLCPRCDDVKSQEEKYRPFVIPRELLPFYRNGVNGHDRDRFFELAERFRLPDGHRCPRCHTRLIPVHHRVQNGRRYVS